MVLWSLTTTLVSDQLVKYLTCRRETECKLALRRYPLMLHWPKGACYVGYNVQLCKSVQASDIDIGNRFTGFTPACTSRHRQFLHKSRHPRHQSIQSTHSTSQSIKLTLFVSGPFYLILNICKDLKVQNEVWLTFRGPWHWHWRHWEVCGAWFWFNIRQLKFFANLWIIVDGCLWSSYDGKKELSGFQDSLELFRSF